MQRRRDRIIIEDLRLPVRIGCSPAERGVAQPVRVDLHWETDFRRGAQEDEPAAMEDYSAVTAALRARAESREWRLVEALAHNLAEVVVGMHPHVVVHVRVTKLGTFVQDAGAVSAECVRDASDFGHGRG